MAQPVEIALSRATGTATIANGASLSEAIDVGSRVLVAIEMSASWTAANLTFAVSRDNVTFQALYDDLGAEYTVPAAAARDISLYPLNFVGWRYIKVRSGTAASPVNQGGARSLVLVSA